ncbi:MAG: hypothetical protein ACO394_14190, partial [Blastocatellia bacterium]
MSERQGWRALGLGIVWFCLMGTGWAETRLLRFPDLHGERVVFAYGGDIWIAPVAGGSATRLTS